MCDGNTAPTKQPLIMISVKSYENSSGTQPSKASSFVTGTIIIGFLVAAEMIMKAFFLSIKDFHPILEDETNRLILARHLGVDTLSCFMVAFLGWSGRRLCYDIVSATIGGKNSMAAGGHEQRIYTYHPEAFRIALVFIAYQVKNLYDTIVWNDGPEYIFHHVLSMTVAWGALYPGVAHMYGIFFFGISEISTGVLCILANFDDEHGVKGLGDAFPLTKVAIGTIFVILFIVCRSVMWPICSYYFVRDSRLALKGDSPKAKGRKVWIKTFMFALTGLSILQVAWLFQIFVIAKKEFKAIGLI